MKVHQSEPPDELEDTGGFANFKLLIVMQIAKGIAKILDSLSYKVLSTPSLKFAVIQLFLLIWGKSTIFSQLYVPWL